MHTSATPAHAKQFITQAWAAFRRLCVRRGWLLVVLAAGLVNLLAGLIFGLQDFVPTTRLTLDFIYANFALAVWVIAIYGSGEVLAVGSADGLSLAAKAVAVSAATLMCLLLAGLAAIGVQLARGHVEIEIEAYAYGLLFNLGWNALHLGALALFFHGLIRPRWLAALATVAVYGSVNLLFDHELLRFGAPIDVRSDISGYGRALAPHVALGIHWSGLCLALLVAVHLRAATSLTDLRRRLTPNVVALGWGGLAVWLVTGAWVLFRPEPAQAYAPEAPNPPQPVYSRLDLQVDIEPEDGRLRSRGSAIIVNRHEAAIPVLHFVVPPALVVDSLALTGEPLATNHPAMHSYRLNRPLAPRETLKVDFDLKARAGSAVEGVSANGTFLVSTDVLPSIGLAEPAAFFAAAPPTAFRVRLGTSLEQIAVGPGILLREWKENGSRYFEYQTTAPIPPSVSLHSARYAVAQDDSDAVPIEVYYHPGHDFAVPGMVARARAQLAALRNDTTDRPRQFRVVEVPDYRRLVRPPGLFAFNWRQPASMDPTPLAGVLPYSELAVLSNRLRR